MELNKKSIENCNHEVSKFLKTLDRIETENNQENVVQTVLKIANFLKFTISSDSFNKVVRFKARHAIVRPILVVFKSVVNHFCRHIK